MGCYFLIEKDTEMQYNSTGFIGCIDITLGSLGGKNGEVKYTNPG